jgi:ABC-type oligopeptide transport system ATPase subunit
MDEPLLVAESLNKSYVRSGGAFYLRGAAKPALIDASLRVNRGEIIGVVGESGSGKTTLARCIALLDRPDTGRVIFKGEDLTKLSGSKLRGGDATSNHFQDPYASSIPACGSAILAEVIRFHRLATGGA